MNDFIERLEALIFELESYNRMKDRSKYFNKSSGSIAWTIEELTQIKDEMEITIVEQDNV